MALNLPLNLKTLTLLDTAQIFTQLSYVQLHVKNIQFKLQLRRSNINITLFHTHARTQRARSSTVKNTLCSRVRVSERISYNWLVCDRRKSVPPTVRYSEMHRLNQFTLPTRRRQTKRTSTYGTMNETRF